MELTSTSNADGKMEKLQKVMDSFLKTTTTTNKQVYDYRYLYMTTIKYVFNKEYYINKERRNCTEILNINVRNPDL